MLETTTCSDGPSLKATLHVHRQHRHTGTTLRDVLVKECLDEGKHAEEMAAHLARDGSGGKSGPKAVARAADLSEPEASDDESYSGEECQTAVSEPK